MEAVAALAVAALVVVASGVAEVVAVVEADHDAGVGHAAGSVAGYSAIEVGVQDNHLEDLDNLADPEDQELEDLYTVEAADYLDRGSHLAGLVVVVGVGLEGHCRDLVVVGCKGQIDVHRDRHEAHHHRVELVDIEAEAVVVGTHTEDAAADDSKEEGLGA